MGVALLGVAAEHGLMATCSGLTEVVARAPGDAVRRVFALQEERKQSTKESKCQKKINPVSLLCDSNLTSLLFLISHFVINMHHFLHELCLLEKVCMLISCNLIIFSSAQELYVKDPSSHDAAKRYQTNISRATATFLTLAQEMKELVEYFEQHNMITVANIVSAKYKNWKRRSFHW